MVTRIQIALTVAIVAAAVYPLVPERVGPVWEIAKSGVAERLLSPGSAVFPESGKITEEDDGRYVIESYVDAENQFGGTERIKWAALVFDNGAAGYEFVDVIFNP